MTRLILSLLLVISVFGISCQSKNEETSDSKKDSMKRILLPTEITNQINSLVKIPDTLQSNNKINPQGCSLECDWFEVCDIKGKCRSQLLCWRRCDHLKVFLNGDSTEALQSFLKTFISQIDSTLKIENYSLESGWHTICNPDCHSESIFWLSSEN